MAHTFTFFRAGGFSQVRLSTAADLAAIGSLDRKLWAALACPVQGLELDERTLALIDGDGDGRVRAPEVIAAVEWCRERLVDLAALMAESPRLPLAAVRGDNAAGSALAACARRVLALAGNAKAADVGLEEIGTAAGGLAKTALNGDGVVVPSATADPALASAIADILTASAPAKDRSGEGGLDAAGLAAFAADAAAWLAWWDDGQRRGGEVLPLGERTAAAYAAVEAVRGKVEDYFLRCRSAAFDPRAAAALNRTEADWAALAGPQLSAEALAPFPLARIAPGAPLPMRGEINPAWAAALAALERDAVAPLCGPRSVIDEPLWRELLARLEAHRAWRAVEPPRVGGLGAARLRELAAPELHGRIAALIAQDLAVKPEFDALGDLERLVRYHRDLYRLLNNFVSFSDVYDPQRLAVFQAGTLYLDGRASELCVLVQDMGRHAVLAVRANAFLVYCDCIRPGMPKRTICAAITNGDADGLTAGRNGLFIDRQGRDWDATVVKVIENPISIREAFWAPYKRVIRFVEDFATKRAAEADKAADARLAGAATATAAVVEKGSAAAPAKPKIDIGTVAALGVAVGGITTALGLVLKEFFGLGVYVPLGVAGLVLAISGPSMALAWLKLRGRTLGPILDASGWAVNGRVSITIPLGAALTELAELPPGSRRQLGDPYAEKRTPWRSFVLLLCVIAAAGWTGWHRITHGQWWWQAAEAAQAPAGKGP